MNKNGCWNRKQLKNRVVVQSGWIYYSALNRVPDMREIENPMTLTCQYQILKKDDKKCEGCKELEL